MTTRNGAHQRPIALIIPAYNESKVIARTLASCWQAGLSPIDVYVVDDGSMDGTQFVAKAAGAANILSTYNRGKAAAIETAIGLWGLNLRYEWVGILDADSQLDIGFLAAVEHGIAVFPDAAVLCGTPRSAPCNWLTAYRAVEYALSLGIYRESQHLTRSIPVAPGCASLYRSSVLDCLNISGDTLVEDMDLTIQVQRQGGRVVYLPSMKVVTQDPKTLRSYIGQISRWYTGTWQVIRKHRLGRRLQPVDIEVSWQVAETFLFLGFLVWAIAFGEWRWLFYAFALDQGFLAAATIFTAINQRRGDVVLWFPTFIVPRLVGLGVFLWSFLRTRRERVALSWYSVGRY